MVFNAWAKRGADKYLTVPMFGKRKYGTAHPKHFDGYRKPDDAQEEENLQQIKEKKSYNESEVIVWRPSGL